jgi:hypothetical protein
MKSRGNKTSKAARAERQAKALELMSEGKNQTEIAAELGISRMTFWRDLQAIEARYVEGSADDVKEFKAAQYKALMQIESATAEGTIPPDVANALTRIRSEVAKLLGLNAPERKVTAHFNGDVDPETLKGYRRFVLETRGLDQEGLQQVYAFARSLARPVAEPAGPPATSPLWLEGK